MLGYRDSGMAGWDGNRNPAAFCNVPVDQAAARVAALIERYEPQVVLTYDETSGGYGHPDHIQTHRVAMAALDARDRTGQGVLHGPQPGERRADERTPRAAATAAAPGEPASDHADGYPGCRDHHDDRHPRRP